MANREYCKAWEECEKFNQAVCVYGDYTEICGKSPKSSTPSGQAELALLDCKTIEACAKLLDAEAARQKAEWEEYLESGEKGPATTYYTLAERYAEMIRGLAI